MREGSGGDTEGDSVVLRDDKLYIGTTELQLFDEHGNELIVDHQSAADGYIVFRNGDHETTVRVSEVADEPGGGDVHGC
jgi:hypothetical protein